MRARLLQWLLAGFLLPLATLLALLFWLLFTPSGARWALQQVPGLHYSSLRGTLMTGLDAHDLRYASAQKSAENWWYFPEPCCCPLLSP